MGPDNKRTAMGTAIYLSIFSSLAAIAISGVAIRRSDWIDAHKSDEPRLNETVNAIVATLNSLELAEGGSNSGIVFYDPESKRFFVGDAADAVGEVGPRGVSGLNGTNGSNGTAGAPGYNGRNGTNGRNGDPGTPCVDTEETYNLSVVWMDAPVCDTVAPVVIRTHCATNVKTAFVAPFSCVRSDTETDVTAVYSWNAVPVEKQCTRPTYTHIPGTEYLTACGQAFITTAIIGSPWLGAYDATELVPFIPQGQAFVELPGFQFTFT